MTLIAPASGAELDALLSGRLRRALAGSVLADRVASVVFDAGEHGVWTVELDRGRGRVRRGGQPDPTLVIRSTPDVLAARGTAKLWEKATGSLPPGLETVGA